MVNQLDLSNYVSVIENKSRLYSVSDIVNVCKRKNNSKRDFLFVNSLQGKHLHVAPSKSFSLFNELALQIATSIPLSEKVVVIGFAETATAIGHYIASALPNCIYYMQTTREKLNNAKLILEFKEEHSHATEQLLYGDISKLSECDHIIFVDDEISTGNTVLNFIHETQKLNIHVKFSVASLLNWQNDKWTEKFQNLGIDCYYIIRGKLKNVDAKVLVEGSDTQGPLKAVDANLTIAIMNNTFSNFTLERVGSAPIPFLKFIKNIYSMITPIISEYPPKANENVLVLGTEEYMYTPMAFAYCLETILKANVEFHATTRSPIQSSTLDTYAIKSCFQLASCYDANRSVFLYNLQKYDKVFIVTDVIPYEEFVRDISSALYSAGCNPDSIVYIIMKG